MGNESCFCLQHLLCLVPSMVLTLKFIFDIMIKSYFFNKMKSYLYMFIQNTIRTADMQIMKKGTVFWPSQQKNLAGMTLVRKR